MRIAAASLACLIAGTLPAFSQTVSGQPATEARPAAAPVAQTVTPASAPADAIAPEAKAFDYAAMHSALAPAKEHAEQAAQPATTASIPTPPAPTAKPAQQAAAAPADGIAPEAMVFDYAALAPAVPLPDAKPAALTPPLPTAKPADLAKRAPADSKPETKTADATCPGHPDAIGTSRTITISPEQFHLIGSLDYKQALPLKDHEIVLTFDDGPIPPYTNSVLDTLAANCVKATYFLVGEMARLRPYLVRRIYNEGHSIGTHSQTHPIPFQHLSMTRVERQVDGGIVSVDNALGDPRALSPFFRIPGFGRTKTIDGFLTKKGLITWSTDVDTDDWWRGTTPSALIARTMKRLNAKGRGIVLMHDIHPSTALALPLLLKDLKKAGYHIVHVVAAGERPQSLPQVVASKAEKENWPRVLHAKAEKSGAAMSALRHRVKNAVADNGKHHKRHSRAAAKTKSPAVASRTWEINTRF